MATQIKLNISGSPEQVKEEFSKQSNSQTPAFVQEALQKLVDGLDGKTVGINFETDVNLDGSVRGSIAFGSIK